VFPNGMLERTLEHNNDDITAGLRKLHSEDLHDLFLPKCYGDEIKQDELGNACGMHQRDKKYLTMFWFEKLKQGDLQKAVFVDSKIILKWILKK